MTRSNTQMLASNVQTLTSTELRSVAGGATSAISASLAKAIAAAAAKALAKAGIAARG